MVMSANASRYRAREYLTDGGPWDPISGGASAVIGTMSTMMMGVADVPAEAFKAIRFQSSPRSKKESSEKKPKKEKSKEKEREKEKGKGKLTKKGGKENGESKEDISAAAGEKATIPTIATTLTDEPAAVAELDGTGTARPKLAAGIRTPESASILSPTESTRSTSNFSQESEQSERGSFMAQAMRQHSEGSRSRSHSPSRYCPSPKRNEQSESTDVVDQTIRTAEAVVGTGKGISRIVGAGLRSPMDMTLAVTRGFHNVPRLYGEEPRHVDKVTDLRSGLRTSGKVSITGRQQLRDLTSCTRNSLLVCMKEYLALCEIRIEEPRNEEPKDSSKVLGQVSLD
jgi:hypothetical protein